MLTGFTNYLITKKILKTINFAKIQILNMNQQKLQKIFSIIF